MSFYPLMLDGAAIKALVIGGGAVATRKVRALLESGATVHVVSPDVSPELMNLASTEQRLLISSEPYSRRHITNEYMMVVAATDDEALNALIAYDARECGRLVNVVSQPELGNCVTPAVHRSGDVVIGVTAGGLPSAAARIRDRIASVVDDRYADATTRLRIMRRNLLDSGQRDHWTAAVATLVGPSFCDDVESGQLDARLREWA